MSPSARARSTCRAGLAVLLVVAALGGRALQVLHVHEHADAAVAFEMAGAAGEQAPCPERHVHAAKTRVANGCVVCRSAMRFGVPAPAGRLATATGVVRAATGHDVHAPQAPRGLLPPERGPPA